MKAYELRALARESLKGKWGKGFVLTLIYLLILMLISKVLSFIPNSYIETIAYWIISPALSFGFLVSIIKLSRDENPTYFEFLNNGFEFLGKLWGIIFYTILKLLLPIFIIVASVFTIVSSYNGSLIFAFLGFITYFVGLIYLAIKSLSYSLTSLILNDEPTLSPKEIVNKSEALMQGNKWRIFYLDLTFIGWAIISILTFGLGLLLLMPYMQVTSLKFYEDLAGDTAK